MITKLLKKATLTLPNSNSTTVLELADGRSEKLYFSQVIPTEFTVSDSEFSLKSGVNVELDIKNVDLVATSEVLWPGQKVYVRGGKSSTGKALKGEVKIPLGKTISSGVPGETWLYWDIETPEGTFVNRTPIHMTGTVKGLPPQAAEFTSQDVISLYDQLEGKFAGSIYACSQIN
ncbi:hypothetical protein ABD76_18370 [Paenibacillus dendritiformis]|uniref:hypothetical protein n=1 Tax=Paenibacillus dendritiformis TaxID=130049 RepID=UPI0018CF5552|nr:hypothetical protein [Paenibacillus dendritiformis]MBG9794366.1 hypothetical protein [Paenibacillus dendritiformis]